MTTANTEDLARALADIEPQACTDYARHADKLVAYANEQMLARPDLAALLGPSSVEVLYANHREHARTFEAQLRLKSASALVDLFVWVYRTHLLRGVALHSFPISLSIWMDGVARYLPPRSAAQINQVYQCLSDHHEQLLLLAHSPQLGPEVAAELQGYFERYIEALLKPDAAAAVRITSEYIKEPAQIATWWESVIKPSLYEVGYRWARGEITVGQEHIATAITQRVMASYYPMILELPRHKGRIVVTASPGELHEIGTRIVADLLEVNGWNVYCTGASTPASSVITLLTETQATYLCISTTLPSSLPAVTALIACVHAADLQPRPKIVVGGQAYNADPALWREVGADYFGSTAAAGLAFIEAGLPDCSI